MCKAWKDQFLDGRAQGRIEGRAKEIIEMGHEFGLSDGDICSRLQGKLDITSEKAPEYLSLFGNISRRLGISDYD